VDITERVCKDA